MILNPDIPWPYHFRWRRVRLRQWLPVLQVKQDVAVELLGRAAATWLAALTTQREAVAALADHVEALRRCDAEVARLDEAHRQRARHRATLTTSFGLDLDDGDPAEDV